MKNVARGLENKVIELQQKLTEKVIIIFWLKPEGTYSTDLVRLLLVFWEVFPSFSFCTSVAELCYYATYHMSYDNALFANFIILLYQS